MSHDVAARTYTRVGVEIALGESYSTDWRIDSDMEHMQVKTPNPMDAVYLAMQVSDDGGTTWFDVLDDTGALISFGPLLVAEAQLITTLVDGVNGYAQGQWNGTPDTEHGWLMRLQTVDVAGDPAVVAADRSFTVYTKV